MPASRWHSSYNELFQWLDVNDDEVMGLLMPAMLANLDKKESVAASSASPDQNEKQKVPDVLPILPLRGVVVYPQTAVPLTVGQPRSIKLVDEVVGTEKRGGLGAAKNPELETPGPNDLYTMGTIAIVHRLLRAPDNTVR